MKTKIANGLKGVSAALACVVVLGCQTPDSVKSTQSAVGAADKLDGFVSSAEQQITSVMTALNGLQSSSADGIASQYNKFSSEVDKLGKLFASSAAQAEAAHVQFDAHLASWQSNADMMSNATLKQQSLARRDQLVAKLGELKESLASLDSSSKPFISDLKDLQTFLGTDLSAGGLSSAGEMITGLKTNAVNVQDDLKGVSSSVADIREYLTAAPAPAAGQ